MSMNTKTKSIAIVILCLSIASYGAEPVSISHSITSCTVDDATATLNLTLEIVNNTTTVLSGAEITTAHMGPLEKRLGLISDPAAMQIGDIPAAGVISVDYTIESAYALPEEAMDHIPIFWEVDYIDETGQQQMIVVRSAAPGAEPEVTTETVSVSVASLSGSGVIEEWVARYNGPGNGYDYANDMAVDSSGNVYVTGQSGGTGTGNDYATIKYDSSGNQLWIARYNGPGNKKSDNAYAIAVDAAGNVYVTGQSYDYYGGTNYDYATVKYDSSGNQLWVARYNGPGNQLDYAEAIAVDASGNVYVTGASWGNHLDYATVKYDSSGNQLWVARYDGPWTNGADWAYAIALDASGNVYVTGASDVYQSVDDYATIKYDSSGNQLWVARYDGPGNAWDCANAMAVDASGNVYVTGQSTGSGPYFNYATVKYDSSGNELWVARYEGPGNWDEANAMAVDTSGNVYVTGRSCLFTGGNWDYATIKYSSLEDPPGAIEALIGVVISLNLQQGITNSLDAKLSAALNALDDVNTTNDGAAVNTLEAFINAVEAQRGQKISETDADGLIQAAVNIINMLTGP